LNTNTVFVVSTGVDAPALLDPAAGALALPAVLLAADVVAEFVGVLAAPDLLLLLQAAAAISARELVATTASRTGLQRNFGRSIAAPLSTRICEVAAPERGPCAAARRDENCAASLLGDRRASQI
jgi:hypothetical protein